MASRFPTYYSATDITIRSEKKMTGDRIDDLQQWVNGTGPRLIAARSGKKFITIKSRIIWTESETLQYREEYFESSSNNILMILERDFPCKGW